MFFPLSVPIFTSLASPGFINLMNFQNLVSVPKNILAIIDFLITFIQDTSPDILPEHQSKSDLHLSNNSTLHSAIHILHNYSNGWPLIIKIPVNFSQIL